MNTKRFGLIVAAFVGCAMVMYSQNAKPEGKEEKLQLPEATRLKFQMLKKEREERSVKVQAVVNMVMESLDKQESDLAAQTCTQMSFDLSTCKFQVTDGNNKPLPLESWTISGVKVERKSAGAGGTGGSK